MKKIVANIIIRHETPEDYEAITQINDSAFGQKNEGQLVENLRRTPLFDPRLSLVAEYERRLIGHILFYPVKVKNDDFEFDSLSLAPMSVYPGFQNQGIGTKLVWNGLKTAEELGFKSVIVLGHAGYYPKFGFEPASKWSIKPPFEAEDRFFMAQELLPGALESTGGVVIYPDEFIDVK